MRKFSLTDYQRRRLRRVLRDSPDVRLKLRVGALLDVGAGEAVASVAARLRVTTRAVYHWVAVYSQKRDPLALCDRPKCGRPVSLNEVERTLIGEALAQPPAELGYFSRERWTVWLIQFHLFPRIGRWLADETVRREIRRQGWVWGRSGYVRAGICETSSADQAGVERAP